MSLFKDDKDYFVSQETMTLMTEDEKYVDDKIAKINKAMMDTIDVDDYNLSEKATVMLSLQLGWVYKLHIEIAVLDKLETQREVVKDNFISTMASDEKAYRKNEFAEKNCEALKVIDKAIKTQGDVILYMKEAIKLIKDFGWTVQRITEIKKLER
jgi:hypothetical protein